jgi:hypothetical protein
MRFLLSYDIKIASPYLDMTYNKKVEACMRYHGDTMYTKQSNLKH